MTWTQLSCHAFRDNAIRLERFALAYNLGNILRRLALPRQIKRVTLTTLREKLIKTGAKAIRHARCHTFQLAEVAVPRELFETILKKLDWLRWVPEMGAAWTIRTFKTKKREESCVFKHRRTISFPPVSPYD